MQSVPLPSPDTLVTTFPLGSSQAAQIAQYRTTAANILTQEDPRLALIVGPCSVHSSFGICAYAEKLTQLQEQLPHLFIVLRVYIEKARTCTGWKGLLYDSDLTGQTNLTKGLFAAREVLCKLTEYSIPLAMEFVDPIGAEYFSDLITWGFIGARTSASQVHRQLAASLHFPIGIKNTLDNDMEIAIEGVASARSLHERLYPAPNGQIASQICSGNPLTHIVLRGGKHGPNYQLPNIEQAHHKQLSHELYTPIMVDCSHGNSQKDPQRQIPILQDVLSNTPPNLLLGCMLESYLRGGSQPFDPPQITPYQSVTDPCLSWDETEQLLLWTEEYWSQKAIRAPSTESITV